MSSDDRKEFMLRMYSAFWDCVSRAEDSAWKITAAYVALFAGLYFFLPVIGAAGVAVIFTVFSFTAVMFALRSNVWFLRNMGLIGNLEREFLDKDDYEVLMPRFFADNTKIPFLNREIWMVQAVSYFAISVAFLVYIFPKIELCEQKIGVAVVFTACLILTAILGWRSHEELAAFTQHAPGKKIDS
jgi:hypothetical protein